MAVPAGPTEKRYTGNGVTKIFTIPFLLLAASDLDVFVNGIEVVSGFTVTGVGNPTSTITFAVAPANLSDILLNLNVPFERLNDYQENGDFLSSTVNRDFDRIWQALKQLLRFSTRALTLGFFDVDGSGWYRAKGNGIRNLQDPVEDQDATTKRYMEQYIGEVIGTGQGPINSAANVIYVYPDGIPHVVQDLSGPTGINGIGAPGGTLADLLAKSQGFQTVALMAAASIPSSLNFLVTACAATAGYGGSVFARYTGPYAADGWCIVQTADGAKWKAMGVPTPYTFGAVTGGDITAAMQRWLTYAATRYEPEMSWSVSGIISSPVAGSVASGSSDYCRNITGKIALKEPSVMVTGTLFKMNDFIQTTVGSGEYIGSILFASRKVYDAFVFKGCKYIDGQDFYIVGCIRHGIQPVDYSTEFKFGHIKTLYNGSGPFQGVPFSATTHFRTGSGLSQRSNFQGFTAPAGVRAGDGLLINGFYYHIRIIDTAGGSMQVFPALDALDLANIAGAFVTVMAKPTADTFRDTRAW